VSEESTPKPSQDIAIQESTHKAYPVFLATAGAFLLSLINASLIAALIAAALAGFDILPAETAESLDQQMQSIIAMEPVAVVAGVLGTSSALFLLAVAFVASDRSRILTRLRLRRPAPMDVVLVVTAMLALTHAMGQLIVLLSLDQVGSLAEFNRMFESWTLAERLRMLPILALCPGVAEEVFFRGYALSKLELALGFRPAMLLTALLFGLIHFDPIHSTAAMGMGLFLAYAIHLTQSLWTTMIAHILNNAIAVLLPNLLPDDFGLQIAVLLFSLFVFAMMLFILSRRHHGERASAEW
jgi:membrane protease YdiL (CAAX protease family)